MNIEDVVFGLSESSDSFFEDVCYLRNISRFVGDSGSETDGVEVIGNTDTTQTA